MCSLRATVLAMMMSLGMQLILVCLVPAVWWPSRMWGGGARRRTGLLQPTSGSAGTAPATAACLWFWGYTACYSLPAVLRVPCQLQPTCGSVGTVPATSYLRLYGYSACYILPAVTCGSAGTMPATDSLPAVLRVQSLLQPTCGSAGTVPATAYLRL